MNDLNLYEVVSWGNDGDCIYTGGKDGEDRCLLVRARSVEEAVALARDVLRHYKTEHGEPAEVAFVALLGKELSRQSDAMVLRGPYLQHAYGHGWRVWHEEADGAWVEQLR